MYWLVGRLETAFKKDSVEELEEEDGVPDIIFERMPESVEVMMTRPKGKSREQQHQQLMKRGSQAFFDLFDSMKDVQEIHSPTTV